MGKNKSASNLVNVIDFNNDRIAFISGSTTLMSISSSGAVTVTGVISGSNAQSASYALNAGLLNNKDSAEFTSTGSFNAYTSSNDATVTSVAGTAVSAVAGVNALAARTSSYTTTSSFNSYTASNNTTMSCVSSTATSAIVGVGALAAQTGSYATTGSNTFVGGQYLSSSFNPTGFSTTASLYTDGGLRVSRDAYISGTLYLNNLTVFGTQSVAYISSSQLNIGTNLITVNTDTPSVRFGGLAVYDSGSTGLTGSILWDSENNRWIYSNPSGSTYDGGMLISGPRNTSGLGNEVGTTSCALMMGQGGDHITSSAIFSYNNATCFYGNTVVSSSGYVCTSTAAFTGCVSVGTAVQCSTFVVKGPFSGGYYPSTATRVPLANFVGDNPELLISDYSNDIGRTATLRLGTTDVDYYCYGAYVRGIQGSGVDSYSLAFGTSQNSPTTTKLTINGAGVACFIGRVCTNGLTTIDQLTATTTNGGTSAIFLNSGVQNSNGIEIRGGSAGTAVNWKIEKDNTVGNALQITPSTAAGGTTYTTPVWTLTSTGIACFTCQVCTPVGVFLGCVGIGTAPTQSGTKLQVAGVTDIWSSANTLLRLNHDGTRGVIETFTGGGYSVTAINPNGGNVGIGTTNPSQQLETTARFVIGNAVTGRVGTFGQATATADTYITIQNTIGNFDIGTSSGGHYFYGIGSLPLRFYTNSTEKMRITDAGIACFACTVCAPTFSGTRFTGTCLQLNAFSSGNGFKMDYGSASGEITAINLIANGTTNGFIGIQMVDGSNGDLWLGGSSNRSMTIYRTGNTGFNTNTPCTRVHSEGGYGSTWGGTGCYYGGGVAGGNFPYGDVYGNGAAYTYQTCNTTANNSSLRGGFAAGYFKGGDGQSYGGGGAGIVAIGGNGANSESVNSGGGAGIFARGGLNGAGSARAFAAWFDGGNVVMRCGRMGLGTCAPTGTLHVYDSIYADYFKIVEGLIGGNQTSVYLAWNNAGNISLQQVTVGAADSGGSGYRLLRVPNT